MSAGNTKTDGNKGNNYPWQIGMLKLLKSIYSAIVSSSPGSIPAGSILDDYFEGATNAQTIALYQAFRASNPTVKIISRKMMVNNTTLTSGLYIEYIP